MSSYPNRNREFQKNLKKSKKHRYCFFTSQNKLRTAEKERKKKEIHSAEFLPEPEQRIPKKIAQKFKKLKNIIMASFSSQNSMGKAE